MGYNDDGSFAELPKRKAERILNHLLAEYDWHEIQDDSKNLKVSNFAWECLRSKEDTIEASTHDSYFSNVQHIEQFFSREEYRDLYIENLTCDVIEKFYTFLLKCGKLVKRKKDDDPGLSRKYVCEISKNFKAMLNDAHDKKQIFDNKDENPAIFLNAIRGHVLEQYFIIALFYRLRRSEAMGLRWKANNLKNGYLSSGTRLYWR